MSLIKKSIIWIPLFLLLTIGNMGWNKAQAQVDKWDSFNREIGFGSYRPLFLNYRYNSTNFLATYKKRMTDRWSFASGLAFGFANSGNIFGSEKSQSFIFDWGMDYRLIRRRIFLNAGPVLTWGYGNWSRYTNGLIAENQFFNFIGVGVNAEMGLRITDKFSFNVSYGRSIGNVWLTHTYHDLNQTVKDTFKGARFRNRSFSTTLSLRF